MAAFVYERIDFVSTKEYSCPSWVRQGKLMRVVRHRALGSRSTCTQTVDIAETIKPIRFWRRYFRVVFSCLK